MSVIKTDNIFITYNLSIITIVGIGLKENSFAIVDAIWALKENNISFDLFDMSPSKISFHIGVSQNIADVFQSHTWQSISGFPSRFSMYFTVWV